REEVEHAVVHLVIEGSVDTMAGENREADFLQGRCKIGGEARFVLAAAVEERREVERGDLELIIELVAVGLRQTICVRLAHLVVLFEVPVEGLNLTHDRTTGAVAASSRCSR